MAFQLKMMIAAHIPSAEEYAISARQWLTKCIDDLFHGFFEPYRNGSKRTMNGVEYFATEFGVNLGSPRHPNTKLEYIPYSHDWLDQLDLSLTARPRGVTLITGRRDISGQITACEADLDVLSVGTGESVRDSGWVQFSASLREDIADPLESRALYERWVDFLASATESLNADYGHIARHRKATKLSALETEIRKPTVYKRTRVLGNYCLRGYEWVTVCGPVVAARLGGVTAVRNSSAFYEVRGLEHGGILMRATPTVEDLDEATLQRIYPVLAPVLIPGRPVVHPHEQSNKNWDPMPILYDLDAADYGSSVPPELDPKGIGMGQG